MLKNILVPDAPRPALLAWVLAIVFFTGLSLLYSDYNSFPDHYHADEPGKVFQILKKERNFNHPLLLLETVDRAVKLRRELAKVEKTRRNVVTTGRSVAAAFSAAAVAALAVTAFLRYGLLAGIGVGLVVGLHPRVYYFAHFFKEDPAFVFGMAMSILAMALFDRKRIPGRLVFLGAACALTASGKYIGLLVPVIALPLVGGMLASKSRGEGDRPSEDSPHPRLWWGVSLFLGAFAATMVVVNLRLLLDFDTFRESLGRELEKATAGRFAVGGVSTKWFYMDVLVAMIPWWLWCCAGWFVVRAFLRRERRYMEEWLLILSASFLLFLISQSSMVSDRYLLPVVVALSYAAVAGVVDLLMFLSVHWKRVPAMAWRAATVVAIGLMVFSSLADRVVEAGTTWWGLLSCRRSFQDDSYARLRQWIVGNLPVEETLLLEDSKYYPDLRRSVFKGCEPAFPHPVRWDRAIIDDGSLEMAAEAGYTHMVTSLGYYGRYLRDAAAVERYPNRARFYRELVSAGRLLWKGELGVAKPLHPGLELWDIRSGGEKRQ